MHQRSPATLVHRHAPLPPFSTQWCPLYKPGTHLNAQRYVVMQPHVQAQWWTPCNQPFIKHSGTLPCIHLCAPRAVLHRHAFTSTRHAQSCIAMHPSFKRSSAPPYNQPLSTVVHCIHPPSCATRRVAPPCLHIHSPRTVIHRHVPLLQAYWCTVHCHASTFARHAQCCTAMLSHPLATRSRAPPCTSLASLLVCN